jgi:hypothetical protein
MWRSHRQTAKRPQKGPLASNAVVAEACYRYKQSQLPSITAGEASIHAADKVFNGMRRVATESLRQPT